MKYLMEILKTVSTYFMGLVLLTGGVFLMLQVWNIIWWQFFVILVALVFGILLIIAAIKDMD